MELPKSIYSLKTLAGAGALVLSGGGVWEGKRLLCAGHKSQPQFPQASQGRSGEARSEGKNINLGRKKGEVGEGVSTLLLTISHHFPQTWACFAHSGNCLVSLSQAMSFSILFSSLCCWGGGDKGCQGAQLAHVNPTMYNDYKQTSKH